MIPMKLIKTIYCAGWLLLWLFFGFFTNVFPRPEIVDEDLPFVRIIAYVLVGLLFSVIIALFSLNMLGITY